MAKKNDKNKGKNEKTNVMRLLEQAKIAYIPHVFEGAEGLTGLELAEALGQNPESVFKTLVTVGKSGEHYVFVIPVAEELDLKKAAASVGEKSIAMIKSKELLPLTGYIHGGCSPIGMKKFFTTTFHETAVIQDRIYFSGGRVGYQVEINPEDIGKIIEYQTGDVIV